MDHYSITGPPDKDREVLSQEPSAETGETVVPPTPEISVSHFGDSDVAPAGAEHSAAAGEQSPVPVSSTHPEAEHTEGAVHLQRHGSSLGLKARG
jgi:hypothetical protein